MGLTISKTSISKLSAKRNELNACNTQSKGTPPHENFNEPWRKRGKYAKRYFVRKLHRNNSIYHQYAEDVGCTTPIPLFTCKLQPTKSKYSVEKIDSRCENVVRKLHMHHISEHCRCDLEYIKTGNSPANTICFCEKRSKKMLRAMKKHDKMCGCGVFDFGMKRKPQSSTASSKKASSSTPRSRRTFSLTPSAKISHPQSPSDELSDEEFELFEGLPRKF